MKKYVLSLGIVLATQGTWAFTLPSGDCALEAAQTGIGVGGSSMTSKELEDASSVNIKEMHIAKTYPKSINIPATNYVYIGSAVIFDPDNNTRDVKFQIVAARINGSCSLQVQPASTP